MPRTMLMLFVYFYQNSSVIIAKILSLKMLKKLLLFISGLTLFLSCSQKKEQVDLIIHNGVIYSVDSNFTTYQAMCVKDGKIVELNNDEEILKKYQTNNIKDLQGKTVFPGF